MNSTEAKAVVKGALRRAGYRWDYFEQTYTSGLGWSKKRFFGYLEAVIRCRGDLLIHKIIRRKLASWHQQVELAAITSEYQYVEDMGNVVSVAIHFLDSRRLLKGDFLNGTVAYTSRLYLHEHFLVRMVQRLGLTGIGDVGKQIYPILHTLISNFPSDCDLDDKFYVITKDSVLVLVRNSSLCGVILKTVLLREQFTEYQEDLFKLPCRKLNETSDGMIMFFPDSKDILEIDTSFDNFLSQKSECVSTFWLKNIQAITTQKLSLNFINLLFKRY